MIDVFAKAYSNVKLPEKKQSSPMGKAKGLLSRNKDSSTSNEVDSKPMERIAKYVASIREDRMRIKDDRDT